MNGYKTVRIRATGQVTEMVPDVARAMILGGTAEEVGAVKESMTTVPAPERAVSIGQSSPVGKLFRSSKKRA